MKRATAYGLKTVRQLAPEGVNSFLRNLPCGPTTRSNQRRELLTLWRWAFDAGATDTRPERVMRVKANRRPPEAWGKETLTRLLEAAEQDTRPVSHRWPNVTWSRILPVWIVVGYDTGLRLTDLLCLRDSDFVNGCVSICAHKTGKPTVRRVSGYGQLLANDLLAESPDGSLFSWCVTRRRALTKWRAFLDELELSGSSKFLRRSAATDVERKRPGAAAEFLTHSNPALARLHYIDQTLLDIPEGPDPLR